MRICQLYSDLSSYDLTHMKKASVHLKKIFFLIFFSLQRPLQVRIWEQIKRGVGEHQAENKSGDRQPAENLQGDVWEGKQVSASFSITAENCEYQGCCLNQVKSNIIHYSLRVSEWFIITNWSIAGERDWWLNDVVVYKFTWKAKDPRE